MGQEILTSAGAVAKAVGDLVQGVSGYTGFRLPNLYSSLPVDGSSIHDNVIGSAITDAMTSWSKLIDADKANVQKIHDNLSAADASSARGFSGGAGRHGGVSGR